jgi:hypothetical protein
MVSGAAGVASAANAGSNTATPGSQIAAQGKSGDSPLNYPGTFLANVATAFAITVVVAVGLGLISTALSSAGLPILGGALLLAATAYGIYCMLHLTLDIYEGKDASGNELSSQERAAKAGQLVGGIAGGIVGGLLTPKIAPRVGIGPRGGTGPNPEAIDPETLIPDPDPVGGPETTAPKPAGPEGKAPTADGGEPVANTGSEGEANAADRTGIDEVADSQRGLPADQRSNTVSRLDTETGPYTGRSGYPEDPHPVVRYLAKKYPGESDGRCAECDAISKALRAREKATGKQILTVDVTAADERVDLRLRHAQPLAEAEVGVARPAS